ncbi:MAG: signal peptidase II [Candidatus Auribacterota bacterium]|jgi:signal peptidase II|nr:signal peptidase II [Candidatus Auribacterota bacterium]
MWIPVIALCIVIVDQITKWIVVNNVDYGSSIPVINGFFNITLVHNPGAAFGFFAHKQSLFIIFTFITIIVISILSVKYAKNDLRLQLFLALVLGGAIGNLIDRIRFQYVIDFIDVYVSRFHWPAFNIADSAICIGIGFLTYTLLKNNEQMDEKRS